MTRTFINAKIGIRIVLPELEQAEYTLDCIANHEHAQTGSVCHVCKAEDYLLKAIQELRKVK